MGWFKFVVTVLCLISLSFSGMLHTPTISIYGVIALGVASVLSQDTLNAVIAYFEGKSPNFTFTPKEAAHA